MNPSKKKNLALIGLLILLAPLIQASATRPADQSAKELAPRFLSEVIGLDLTKYNLTKEGYGSSYPSSYGGEVKEEVVTFELASDHEDLNNLRVMSIFRNGLICTFKLYEGRNSPIYLQESSTDAVYISKNILQRYKTFAQNLGWNTQHVDQALTMLNNVSAASTKGDLPMFNNVFGFVPSVTYEGNMKLQANEKRVNWFYIEEGWDMPSKCLSISFGSSRLSFADTWNLFEVGSLSVISEEEAKSIGWEAAKNYNVTFTYENGTTVPVSPKWSNVSEINFYMTPGQKHNQTPEEDFVNPGSVIREPLSLYPMWQMIFYFEDIGGAAGIQVGVWGDTKEIAYISLYGYLGAPTIPDTESTPENPAGSPDQTVQPAESPSQTPNITNVPSAEPDDLDSQSPQASSDPLASADPEDLNSALENKQAANDPVYAAAVAIATILSAAALIIFSKRKMNKSSNCRPVLFFEGRNLNLREIEG